MRFGTLLVILATSVVTQSCKIEMPSLIDLLSKYGPYTEISLNSRIGLYDFKTSRAITAQGGFKDTLIIGDTPATRHANLMLSIMSSMGIPEDENVVLFDSFNILGPMLGSSAFARGNAGLRLFTSEEHEVLRKATRVIHLPWKTPFRAPQDPPRVQAGNGLFVIASTNVRDSFEGDRDMYNIKHILWNDSNNPEWDAQRKIAYKSMLDVYSTGKAIAATSARVTEEGTIESFSRVVPCGDIKEACFTVIPQQYTSTASARLAAMSFYLSQFWETPEEVVDVLKQCTIDVGEPGVDREYGQGVANLLCPPVLKKELEVVSSYLEETEEIPQTEGGEIEGTWIAESTVLEMHIPTALKETLQIQYAGEVVGTVAFTKNTVQADFRAEATVNAVFLMPLEATATEVVEVKGAYTAMQDTLRMPGGTSLTYTTTKDSLHLVRSLTLNEALALLPDPLGSMVDMASEDFFVEDPIQIRMSFSKKPTLPGDFDENNLVDFADFLLFVNAFGTSATDTAFDVRMDLVSDGMINFADFLVFVTLFSENG